MKAPSTLKVSLAAALVGALALASAGARAEERTLDFEKVYASQDNCDGCLLDSNFGTPPGYVDTGLSFKYWATYNAWNGIASDQDSGFPLALRSGKYIAVNYASQETEITATAAPFNLVSAHMNAAFRDGLTLNIIGSKAGAQVFSQQVVLQTEESSFVQFNTAPIDHVIFSIDWDKGEGNPFYGQSTFYWAMDDFTVNVTAAVPEPSTYALMVAGLAVVAAMAGLARRRRSA